MDRARWRGTNPHPDTCRTFPFLSFEAVDGEIPEVKGEGSREQTERHRPAPTRYAEGVLDELVGNGADQDARTEGHDESKRVLADRASQCEHPPSSRDEPAFNPHANASATRTQSARTIVGHPNPPCARWSFTIVHPPAHRRYCSTSYTVFQSSRMLTIVQRRSRAISIDLSAPAS